MAEIEQPKKSKIEVAKEAHAEANKERKAKQETLKIVYKKATKNEALLDIIAKIKAFGDYHLKVAKDGLGSRVDESGQPQTIFLSNEERMSHLDRAAGIEELGAYIDRQLS